MADQQAQTIHLGEIHVAGRGQHVPEHGWPEGVDIKDDPLVLVARLHHELRLPVEGFEVRLVDHLEFEAVVLGIRILDLEDDVRGVVQDPLKLVAHRGDNPETGESASIYFGQGSGELKGALLLPNE